MPNDEQIFSMHIKLVGKLNDIGATGSNCVLTLSSIKFSSINKMSKCTGKKQATSLTFRPYEFKGEIVMECEYLTPVPGIENKGLQMSWVFIFGMYL